MRRMSQRQSLVTLSEINITPLLDLAFVLLIIFVITTPLLEQGIDLKLPKGGRSDSTPIGKNDVKTVEVSQQGVYITSGARKTLDQLEQELVLAQRKNPNLIVFIRADGRALYEYVAAVLERCEKNGISRLSMRTEPVNPKR